MIFHSTIGGIQKTIKDRQKHIIQIEKLGEELNVLFVCVRCMTPMMQTIQRLTNEIEDMNDGRWLHYNMLCKRLPATSLNLKNN
jgi:hypothetical protein